MDIQRIDPTRNDLSLSFASSKNSFEEIKKALKFPFNTTENCYIKKNFYYFIIEIHCLVLHRKRMQQNRTARRSCYINLSC